MWTDQPYTGAPTEGSSSTSSGGAAPANTFYSTHQIEKNCDLSLEDQSPLHVTALFSSPSPFPPLPPRRGLALERRWCYMLHTPMVSPGKTYPWISSWDYSRRKDTLPSASSTATSDTSDHATPRSTREILQGSSCVKSSASTVSHDQSRERGPQFIVAFRRYLCTRRGTAASLLSLHHSQADGQKGRFNALIEQTLRC